MTASVRFTLFRLLHSFVLRGAHIPHDPCASVGSEKVPVGESIPKISPPRPVIINDPQIVSACVKGIFITRGLGVFMSQNELYDLSETPSIDPIILVGLLDIPQSDPQQLRPEGTSMSITIITMKIILIMLIIPIITFAIVIAIVISFSIVTIPTIQTSLGNINSYGPEQT